MKFILSMLAIISILIGTVAAEQSVTIMYPVDGQEIMAGSTIKIKCLSESIDEDFICARMFLNGERFRTSRWTPTAPGEYTIRAELANNAAFRNAVFDEITVTVV